MRPNALFVGFQAAAGTCDTLAGILLILLPSFTLRLMGVRQAITEPIFISFIGAFVLAIGLSYLLFIVPPRNASDLAGVRAAWLITGLVRLCVGTFVIAACVARQLDPAWLTVAIVDYGVAAFQFMARRTLLARFA
jgi:hypothetical protein